MPYAFMWFMVTFKKRLTDVAQNHQLKYNMVAKGKVLFS